MDIPKVYEGFIKNLINLTNEGKVTWKKIERDYFTLFHNGYKLAIYFWSDINSELSYYSFTLNRGNIEDGYKVSNLDYGYELMEEMFGAASINSQNISDELDDFLKDFE